MSGDAKQRLMSILVGEVSLVDHPANEVDFLIAKSLEGLTGDDAEKMLEVMIEKCKVDATKADQLRAVLKTRTTEAPVADNNAAVPTSKASLVGVQLDPYTAVEVTLNAARSRLYDVQDALREGKDPAAASAKLEEIKTMLDNAANLSSTITKSVTDFTAGIGAVVAEVTKADKDGKKQKLPPWMAEKLKALNEELTKWLVEDGAVTAPTEKAVEDVLADVVKAGKAQFSKERLAKLKEGLAGMAGILKEADGEGYAAWHGALAPTPPAAEVAKAAPAAGAPAIDPAMTEVLKQLGTIGATLSGLATRVESVEKANATSNALPEKGATEVEKAKPKSLFTGVV